MATNTTAREERVSPRYHLRLPACLSPDIVGTSFKPAHLSAILADDAHDGFFEVHAENYMGAGGPPHRALERIRLDHPLSLHGVCMSIGGLQPLDQDFLDQGRHRAHVVGGRFLESGLGLWPHPDAERVGFWHDGYYQQ